MINNTLLIFSIFFPAFQILRFFSPNLPIPNHFFFGFIFFLLNFKKFKNINFNLFLLITILVAFFLFKQINNYNINNFILILYIGSFLFAYNFAMLIPNIYIVNISTYFFFVNVFFCIFQLIFFYKYNYSLMFHSNINIGYKITDHSYLKIIFGYSVPRLTGLFNENGPFCCFLLLYNYLVLLSTSKVKIKLLLFLISFMLVFLTGSKFIFIFLILGFYLTLKKFHLKLLLFLIFVLIISDLNKFLNMFDFRRRFNDLSIGYDNLSNIGYISSTVNSGLQTLPQDFIGFNVIGLGIILTLILFIFLILLINQLVINKFLTLICFISLLSMAGSLSNFLWFYFLLILFSLNNAKSNPKA